MKPFFFQIVNWFFEKYAVLKEGLGLKGSEGKKEAFTEILTGLAKTV